MNLQRWKKAVVHLECAADEEHFHDHIRRWDDLRQQYNRGEIGTDDLEAGLSGGGRELRYRGTAVFLKHESQRYLLTARHVLWNEQSAKRELQEETERLKSWSEESRPLLVQLAVEKAMNQVFEIIFRVPTLDELIGDSGLDRCEYLMNLGAGAPAMAPYTFSDVKTDLAIISLDQRDKRFADELEAKGCEPISLVDIAEEPTTEGTNVFTVGFPGEIAEIRQVELDRASSNWPQIAFPFPCFRLDGLRCFTRISITFGVT